MIEQLSKEGAKMDEALRVLGVPDSDRDLMPWEKARLIIENFNVPALGEEKAFDVLIDIVNYVRFPDVPTTNEYVGRVEGLLAEILDIDADREIHMDHVAFWGTLRSEGVSLEEIRRRIKGEL